MNTAAKPAKRKSKVFSKLPLWRSLVAPEWRRFKRFGLVASGLSIYFYLQYWLANQINSGKWIGIVILFLGGPFVVATAYNPVWGYLLWLFVSPFGQKFFSGDVGGGYMELSFDKIAVIVILVATLIYVFTKRLIVTRLRFHEWLLLLSGVQVMASKFYLIDTIAITSIVTLAINIVLLPIIVYIIARTIVSSQKSFYSIVYLFIVIAVFWAITGMIEQLIGYRWYSAFTGVEAKLVGADILERSTGPLGTYYVYGFVLIVGISLMLWIVSWNISMLRKTLLYVFAITSLLALYWGYSRAPYISFAFYLFFAPLVVHKEKRPRYLIHLLAIISVFLVIAIPKMQSDVNFGNRMLNKGNIEDRQSITRTSINMFRDNWLLGVGYGEYQKRTRDYSTRLAHSGSYFSYVHPRPHNEYWAALAERGIVGFLLYFGAVAGFIIDFIRKRAMLMKTNPRIGELMGIILIWIGCYLLMSNTDEFYKYPYMYYFLFTIFAMGERITDIFKTDESDAIVASGAAKSG